MSFSQFGSPKLGTFLFKTSHFLLSTIYLAVAESTRSNFSTILESQARKSMFLNCIQFADRRILSLWNGEMFGQVRALVCFFAWLLLLMLKKKKKKKEKKTQQLCHAEKCPTKIVTIIDSQNMPIDNFYIAQKKIINWVKKLKNLRCLVVFPAVEVLHSRRIKLP